MNFTLQTLKDIKVIEVKFDNLFVIGYAGRNIRKTISHIKELEKQLGVPAPNKIPTIFQCSNTLLTQEENIHFIGDNTCGEVEYVIVLLDGNIYIGIGSDHTDRKLESISVLKAKQICPKPIGNILWDYKEIKDHWDDIKLVSYQEINGKEVMYQNGTLADILTVEKILGELEARVGDIKNSVIYSGTVPLEGDFLFGERFRCEMIDEKYKRKITSNYNVIKITEEER